LILYDENYNFLAISNETVSFLGYENIDEFISLNSDFADLLVAKEGKIYKFKNFSWIDFILYSGAPNKSAIIKLKDGSEIDIKLTVKELTLTRDIDGLEKCFAVRIISDEFVKIASKVNKNMKFEVNKNVALSNLLNEPSVAKTPDLKQTTPTADIKTCTLFCINITGWVWTICMITPIRQGTQYRQTTAFNRRFTSHKLFVKCILFERGVSHCVRMSISQQSIRMTACIGSSVLPRTVSSCHSSRRKMLLKINSVYEFCSWL